MAIGSEGAATIGWSVGHAQSGLLRHQSGKGTTAPSTKQTGGAAPTAIRSMGRCRRPNSVPCLLLTCCLLFPVACNKSPEPSQAAAEPASSTAPAALLARPHVTLVALTDWQATLKPCGCTVELQKGGIERIARWLGDLRRDDDSVLVVHAGSLLHDDEPAATPAAQAQLALRRQVFGEALAELKPAAVALSSWDLASGPTEVTQAYSTAAWPVLALAPVPGVARAETSKLVRTKSGVAVGLLSVDPAATTDEATRARLVQAEVEKLKQQGAQVLVVLSNLGLRSSRRLARAVPSLDAVVVGHLDERAEPQRDLDREGNTLIVHAARHGAWFATLTLVADPAGGPWRDADAYLPGVAAELTARRDALQAHFSAAKARGLLATERALPFYEQELADLQRRIDHSNAVAGQPVPGGRLAAYRSVGLDWSAPTDASIAALVQRYDSQAAASAEQLAAAPVPAVAGQPHYIGYGECLGCHMTAQVFSLNDLHGKAWQTLETAGKTRDLDCVPCHSTGWLKPGGSALANIGKFSAVRCEACHGPGSDHRISRKAAALGGGKMGTVKAAVCEGCHTAQHSPRFDFESYRQRLLVPGHGTQMLKAAAPQGPSTGGK